MRLSLEQIKSITVGALNIWAEDGAIHFAKCTPKQIDAWYKVEQILGERAEATTGIRLDFHTNSKTFAFATNVVVHYEIYIDNVLTYAYFKTDFEVDMSKKIELDGEEHRITLYLPSHDKGILESVEIDDVATLVPHKYDCKMLFIGDSITQGCESTWDSLSYANQVSRFFNAESVIQGISGAFYQMTTFDEKIGFDPDIVVVAYGTNDWNHRHKTLKAGREHCRCFLDQLIARYSDKKLFGISPIWRADNERISSMGRFEECNAYIKEEIANHGMTVIDGQKLTPHLPDFYSDKYLHPDTKGFGVLALNLISELQKYLYN